MNCGDIFTMLKKVTVVVVINMSMKISSYCLKKEKVQKKENLFVRTRSLCREDKNPFIRKNKAL